MANITIVCKNQSTALKDSDIQFTLAAFELQLNRDFCPSWGIPDTFKLEFRSKSAKVNPGEWPAQFLDHTSEAGALGFHTLSSGGSPMIVIGVKDCIDSGTSWQVCASHEFLETAGDPLCDQIVISKKLNRAYAKEAADATESDAFAKEIVVTDATGTVISRALCSDFVLPSFWDDSGANKGISLSFNGHTVKPFHVESEGYLSWYSLSDPNQEWQQTFGMHGRTSGKPGTTRGAMRRHVQKFGHKLSTAD